MSVIDEAIAANQIYSRTHELRKLTPRPARKLAVLTCMDTRLSSSKSRRSPKRMETLSRESNGQTLYRAIHLRAGAPSAPSGAFCVNLVRAPWRFARAETGRLFARRDEWFTLSKKLTTDFALNRTKNLGSV